jgi:hypothetical protein
MIKFKLWKTEHLAGDNPPWHTYCLLRPEMPTIQFTEDKLLTLFPDLDPKLIPIAPNTLNVTITLKIRKKQPKKEA